jgi:hypothetical protein
MAHYLGALLKYLAALAIFVFSVSRSYAFFSEIAPPDMPWFVWAAMGLTEFGLICWLFVFKLQHHSDSHKTIAVVMIFVCVVAVLFTDAMELAKMFHITVIIAGIYYYVLIVLFAAHLIAFIADFFVGYFANHSFYGAPPQHGGQRAPLKEAERPAYGDGLPEQRSYAASGEVETRGPKGPGLVVRAAAAMVDAGQQVRELAEEKRRQRKEPDPLAEASQEDEADQGS